MWGFAISAVTIRNFANGSRFHERAWNFYFQTETIILIDATGAFST
jgi:hypothetical protein